MPIDPNIILQAGQGVTPLANPAQTMAQATSIMAAKQAFEDRKRKQQEDADFKGIAEQAKGDIPTMISMSRQRGLTTHADALEDHYLKTQETLSKLDASKQAAIKNRNEQLAKAAIAADTPEKWAFAARQFPELGEDPSMRNQFIFQARTIDSILSSQDKAQDRLWEREKFDETRRHNRAMENKPTSEGQPSWSSPMSAVDANGSPVLIQADKFGNVKKVDGFGPKPTLGTAKNPGKTDTGTALSILDEADKLVEAAPGSYLGAGGRLLNKTIGRSTESTQAQSQLEALQASLMMRMPRMEGPQSDKDVQLYREQAGKIADPTVPAGDKKAAIRSIRNILSKYQTAPQAPKGAASVDDLLKALGH